MKRKGSGAYFALIEEWQASGLSRAAFAASKNIPRPTFYYWLRKYGSATPPTSRKEKGFSQIHIPTMGSDTPHTRVYLPGGAVVEFYGALAGDTLLQLLKTC
jgi:hypothetical protein